MTIDRRTLMTGGMAAMAAASGLGASPASAKAAPADKEFAALAQRLVAQNAARISLTDRVGIVDYAAPSWRPRFHLVDMISGEVSSYLVSHGRGSDPGHTGWLQRFSNKIGSNASSGGAYLTGANYVGKHGPSMRLDGLDPENSNARRRAIVVHAAWYAAPEMIDKYGKLGRSEGCFAFSEKDRKDVMARLGEGRLLYAGKF